ncbi:cation diffusion facilitator family transporter [Fusobacterium nucleatum]|uniref:cation diffusion facilitator family transporter n=1 Tax=Fusobacterium nucleatum TaxID=851 RepID=UPI0030CBEFC5
MKNENAILNVEELNDLDENSLYLDELEEELQEQLDFEISEFEFLKKEKDKIGSPEALGETIKGVIWDQFMNQVSNIAGEEFIKENGGMTLDLRDEAHIQTSENFENGKIAKHNTEIDYQERFDEWQSNFQKNEDGSIKTNKTGKKILTKEARKDYDEERGKGTASMHKDHTISVAEIIRDPETAAHMSKKNKIEFANSEENLNDLDSSANMSKGDKKMTEWLDSKRNGKKPSERFNIDEEELREEDKIAREEYEKKKTEGKQKSIETGKKSQKEEAFRIGGKALKSAIMTLLVTLLKNIIGKLIKWFRTAKKSFSTLVEYIKEAFTSFLNGIKSHLVNSAMGVFNTVAMSIFNPISRILKNAWTILKQGWKSLKEAFNYIKNPENREKPIGILLLEIGKIIIMGISAVGAIALGEVIEVALSGIPFLAIEIPLLGSLANIIGIFMGASISGIIGAIGINLIQKSIEKRLKNETLTKQIDKGNEVLLTQYKIQKVNEQKLIYTKVRAVSNIKDRHEKKLEYIEENEKDIEEKEKALKSELEEYTKNANKNLDDYIEENSIVITHEELEKQKKKDEEFDNIDSLLNDLFD